MNCYSCNKKIDPSKAIRLCEDCYEETDICKYTTEHNILLSVLRILGRNSQGDNWYVQRGIENEIGVKLSAEEINALYLGLIERKETLK